MVRVMALISLLIVIVGPSAASAGEIERGTTELTTESFFDYTSFSADGDDAGSLTHLRVQTGVGYFATSLVEIRTEFLVDHTSESNGNSYDATSFGFVGAVTFNFATDSNFIPFASAGAGIVTHSGDVTYDEVTVLAPAIEAGLRFLVGSSASVNLGLLYEYQMNAEGVKDLNANVIRLGVGISAFVKGGLVD